MMDFLSGAVTLAYLVSGFLSVRVWSRTSDRLFLAMGVAFDLLAINQALFAWLGQADERVAYTYILRVISFSLVLLALLAKSTRTHG
jgi:hypothetical protein